MALGNGSSDLFKLVALLGAYDYEGSNPNFCGNNFVRAKVNTMFLLFPNSNSICFEWT
jgi:hypothetical protein